jgi:PAS domain S-box-containing protein
MNKLLERQIKKYLDQVNTSDPKIQDFLKAVNDAYDSAESDQDLINRSLDISSKEIIERSKLQQQEAAANEKAIAMLRTAVTNLDPQSFTDSIQHVDPTQEVARLAQYLSDLTVKYKENMYELTIQKIHAERLSSELQVFKFAVENAADYIVFLDSNSKIVYANSRATLGFNLKDTTGKTIDEVYAGLGISGTMTILKEHIEKGDKQFTVDIPAHNLRGDSNIIQGVVTITKDDNGRMLVIIIGRDITKDRALEREKEEFVSIASHELRTPMTVIRGYVNVLIREQVGTVNAEQKTILNKINDSATGLINFVAEMLDSSKLDVGKFTMNVVDGSLDQLVNESVESVRLLFDNKGIKLENNIGPAQIKTDPGQFKRIIANLLGNANKFTNSGGTVTISSTVDDVKHLATICITDTGVGIPADAIGNLFKKFSQVDNVLKRQSGGSGLGLVISKQLVEKLGGTIWATSKLGEGSQFYFTMPTV